MVSFYTFFCIYSPWPITESQPLSLQNLGAKFLITAFSLGVSQVFPKIVCHLTTGHKGHFWPCVWPKCDFSQNRHVTTVLLFGRCLVRSNTFYNAYRYFKWKNFLKWWIFEKCPEWTILIFFTFDRISCVIPQKIVLKREMSIRLTQSVYFSHKVQRGLFLHFYGLFL